MFDIKLVAQPHETDCGPASLKMLLAFYGHDVDLATLHDECQVSVNGCTAKDLLRVGKDHGLNDMAAFKTDAASVMRQDRPAILLWRHTHFLVYGGLNDKGEPMIFNPASGVYPIDAGTFKVLFSDIMLTNGTPADIPPEDYFGENETEDDYFHN